MESVMKRFVLVLGLLMFVFIGFVLAELVVTKILQSPDDLTSLNAVATGVNFTYNVTGDGLNRSTVHLYYKVNRTSFDYAKFVNGSAITGFSQDEGYSSVTSDNVSYLWLLDDNEIYPATYNLPEILFENFTHGNFTLSGATNRYLKWRFFNVSNATAYNWLEINARNTTTTSSGLRVYLCNSTYVTGNPSSSLNCYLAHTILASDDYNHCHTEHGAAYSCHHLIPLAINTTSGTIGTIKVTSTFYVVLRSPSNGAWNISKVDNISRDDTTGYSTNSGAAWTNQTFTVDSHIHQYDGTDSLWVYVSAANTSGDVFNSSLYQDVFELAAIPPTDPVVYSPTEINYSGFININYTAAISLTGNAIANYSIYLHNYTLGWNQTISANNYLNLSYRWNSSEAIDGTYKVFVIACSNISLCSTGLSEPFVVDNTAPNVSFVSPTNVTYTTSSVVVNITNSSDVSSVWWNNGSANLTYTSEVTLTLSNGNYNFTAYANDSAGNLNSSLIVFSVNVSSSSSDTTTSSSAYSSKIYYSDVNLPTRGNNFSLRYNDKIKFVVNSTNHTLTMQNFNSTTARVVIQSNPLIVYLQKGILREFDLNNDSVNDVRVRYDGLNKTSAMIFIQEIKAEISSAINNENIVENFEDKKINSFNWKFFWACIVLVLIILFVVVIFMKRKKIEEYLWIKRIERSRRK